MHCQLYWTVASIPIIDSKSIADAMVCVYEVIVESVGVNPLILYVNRAYSLAPARVTSSVCLRVRDSRPDVIVRLHSYDDIGSITTQCVAAAYVVNNYCVRPSERMIQISV